MKHTDLIVILDRSGSMSGIRTDVMGGFDQMMKEQAALEGTCNVTLVQFDGIEVETVCTGVPVSDMEPLQLSPRSNTPLLDAVGQTVARMDDEYGKMDETKRPEQVLVLIITDGQENASVEFTLPDIRKLIEEHENRGWVFSYLGANVDAFAEAIEEHGGRGAV